MRNQARAYLVQQPRRTIGEIADAMHVEDEAVGFASALEHFPYDELRAIEGHFALQAESFDA